MAVCRKGNSMNYNQIGEVTATFQTSGTVNVGDLVAMAENSTVETAAANDEVIGVCVSKNGSYVGVQLKGGTTLACSDSTLTVGYHQLKAASGNSIALATEGAYHLVVSVDTGVKTAMVIL